MTLPAAGTLTIAQINAELDSTGSVTIPNNDWLTLAGKAAGSSIVIPTDYYSKVKGAFTDAVQGNTAAGSASMAGAVLGAVGPSRRIICAVGWEGATATAALMSSATIGGVAATIHTHISNAASTNAGSGIISAIVPAGTTGTIVINLNQADARIVRCGVYRYIGPSGATDTISVTADLPPGSQTLSTAITIAPGSILVVSGVTSVNPPVGNITFTGVTELDENTVGPNCRMGSGMLHHLGSQARIIRINNTVPSGIGGFFMSAVSIS